MITPGRIVLYALTGVDAEQINRRRTTGREIAERIKTEQWPLGAQAHIGNSACAGEVFPLLVTRVWPDEYGSGHEGVNGQVFLDGNDVLWVTSVKEDVFDAPVHNPGTWRRPIYG